MLIKEIFGQQSHWQINKAFAKTFGIESALLLTDLVDKWGFFGYEEYFFNTSENIENDTTLSRYQQDRALRILQENLFIECKLMGVPAKKHFKINQIQLLNFFQPSLQITNNPVCEKLTNKVVNKLQTINKNKVNNNKLNNSVSETNVSTTKPDEKKEVQQSLFPETELVNPENKTTKKVAQKKVKKPIEPDNEVKRLFRNSDVYKMVKFDENKNGDYSEFENRFNTPEFAPIDLVYYFHVVSDWSDLKNEKRTKNGWIATVRTFIRGDAEKNKVKLKPEFQPNKNDDNQAMLDILNSR